ncbi:MAG: tetratricopeptide repeat protein [Myxococcaceae bacterium]|nr:tetratricopeptide repeat protein [Myxococcaceae bacterium]
MKPRAAQDWYEQGRAALELSWSADTHSDLQDDYRRALDCFEQCLALDPNHPAAQGDRAHVLAKLGRHDEAVDALVAAAHTGGATVERLVAAAASSLKLGQTGATVVLADQALARSPAHLEALVLRAEALSLAGRDAEAVTAWDRALSDAGLPARFPVSRCRCLRARSVERLGRADALATWVAFFVDEARTVQWPGCPAVVLETLEASALAREAFTRSLEQGAGGAELVWLRGANVWLRAHRPEEALAASERQLALTPRSFDAWVDKAEAHAAAGRLEEAVAAFERARALNPTHLGVPARLKVVRAQLAAR